jgi:hypothetical protein
VKGKALALVFGFVSRKAATLHTWPCGLKVAVS